MEKIIVIGASGSPGGVVIEELNKFLFMEVAPN